jgi:RAVE protein 1 C terminal
MKPRTTKRARSGSCSGRAAKRSSGDTAAAQHQRVWSLVGECSVPERCVHAVMLPWLSSATAADISESTDSADADSSGYAGTTITAAAGATATADATANNTAHAAATAAAVLQPLSLWEEAGCIPPSSLRTALLLTMSDTDSGSSSSDSISSSERCAGHITALRLQEQAGEGLQVTELCRTVYTANTRPVTVAEGTQQSAAVCGEAAVTALCADGLVRQWSVLYEPAAAAAGWHIVCSVLRKPETSNSSMVTHLSIASPSLLATAATDSSNSSNSSSSGSSTSVSTLQVWRAAVTGSLRPAQMLQLESTVTVTTDSAVESLIWVCCSGSWSVIAVVAGAQLVLLSKTGSDQQWAVLASIANPAALLQCSTAGLSVHLPAVAERLLLQIATSSPQSSTTQQLPEWHPEALTGLWCSSTAVTQSSSKQDSSSSSSSSADDTWAQARSRVCTIAQWAGATAGAGFAGAEPAGSVAPLRITAETSSDDTAEAATASNSALVSTLAAHLAAQARAPAVAESLSAGRLAATSAAAVAPALPLPPRLASCSTAELLALWAVVDAAAHGEEPSAAALNAGAAALRAAAQAQSAGSSSFAFGQLRQRAEEAAQRAQPTAALSGSSSSSSKLTDPCAKVFALAQGLQTRTRSWRSALTSSSSTSSSSTSSSGAGASALPPRRNSSSSSAAAVVAEHGATASSAVLGMLLCSEQQQQLTLEALLAHRAASGGAEFDWPAARAAWLPLWLRDPAQVKRAAEAVAGATYRSSRDIMAAAVHYIALGKESTLLALAKADSPHPLARPLSGKHCDIHTHSIHYCINSADTGGPL